MIADEKKYGDDTPIESTPSRSGGSAKGRMAESLALSRRCSEEAVDSDGLFVDRNARPLSSVDVETTYSPR